MVGPEPERPPRQRSDGEVVRRCLDGEKELFGLLVRRYQDVLFRHARGMVGGDDDAADMVQRTFIRGYRKLESCRNPEKVGGWLFRICSNLCRDHLKDPRRRSRPLEAVAPAEAERGNPVAEVERVRLGDAIEEALAALSPDQREAFLLKHVEGLSYEEMSELLEASVAALKMRVHRAREELSGLLAAYR